MHREGGEGRGGEGSIMSKGREAFTCSGNQMWSPETAA